jgi:hypothetical protein
VQPPQTSSRPDPPLASGSPSTTGILPPPPPSPLRSPAHRCNESGCDPSACPSAHTGLCRSADRARSPGSAGQGACASTPRASSDPRPAERAWTRQTPNTLTTTCTPARRASRAMQCCTRLWHVRSAPSVLEHVMPTPCPSTVSLSTPAFRSSPGRSLAEGALPAPPCHALSVCPQKGPKKT